MKYKDKQMCFNCKHRIFNVESCVTECSIPKEEKNSYFTKWVKHYNDADWCPFKELEDGGEYSYWK